MLSSIQAFSDQLAEGWATARSTSWAPPAIDTLTEVAVLGLGGSAFGGEVIRNLLYATSPLPYLIYRGYEVPAHIGSKSLVLVSSYSGNTEETVAAAQLAFGKGAHLGVICSGGLLSDWALERGLPVFRLPGGFAPRAACAFSITHQLEIAHRLGLLPDYSQSLQQTIERLNRFSRQSALQELAQQLSGKWVALYAEDRIESAVIRLRQQINENAKQLCHHHVIPEMNHNELVGWPLPAHLERVFLALRHPHEHPRNRLRFDFMANEARVLGHPWLELHTEGKDPLEVLLDLIHTGDWLSVYLAEVNGVDPSPVAVIDRLKSSLAQFA